MEFLMLERNFKYILIVGDKVRFQATCDEVWKFGKVVAILFGENDASDATSFRLQKKK